ncbi:MAG: ribose 5-phosphate isomerase B [bacterium JZ-2024 1]
MRVGIGADHNGYALKQVLRRALSEAGYEVVDFGTHSEEPVDYPDFAWPLARAVANGEVDRGVLICGTGIGMAMVANRVPGVRAANCNDLFAALFARRDNDANVLTLGGRILAPYLAREIVQTFLNTDFDGGRHIRRIQKIDRVLPTELTSESGS